MVIIHSDIENENEFSKAIWRPIIFKIDPNSDHKTDLPGDHCKYSHALPKKTAKWIDEIQNFEVRTDDIWIVGIIKTGTTWNHNIAYTLKYGLDCENIAEELENRYFEKGAMRTDSFDKDIKRYKEMKSPRIFKTHLPAFLLPNGLWTVKPKIIYTIRNPKDALVSAYHMMRNSYVHFSGTLENFCEMYFNDIAFSTPIFDHLRGFLQLRNRDHILFAVYEEMIADPFRGVKRICEFLECPHSDEQLQRLNENVSFEKMREKFPSFMLPDDRSTIPDPDYKYEDGFCLRFSDLDFRFGHFINYIFQILPQRKSRIVS